MNHIQIVADSTCDLSQDLIEKYNIRIIPLMISMGEKTFRDGVEIKPKEIYEWSDRTGETPKTAAPIIGDAIEILKPFVEEKKDIIFFGISEAMSVTCNTMRLISEEMDYKKIHVVDSENLSTGIGLQIIRAAELVEKGYRVEEILEDSKKFRKKVNASFVVDNLTFLHRGGRCSGITALFGNKLKMKPEIVVTDGKMGVGKKYRGSQKNVILKYITDQKEELLKADSARIFITHSGCPDEIIMEAKEYLENLNVFKEIVITRAGGVISSHCGPNTLGILYIRNH